MPPGPCAYLFCYGHGCGVLRYCNCLACLQARRAHRVGKLLCRTGRAEQLAYGTVFMEGLDMGQINVSTFYSALLRRGLGCMSPFFHQLTPTDVETHYKMVCFVRYDFFSLCFFCIIPLYSELVVF